MTPTTDSPQPDTSWWDWVLANGPGISAVAATLGSGAAIVAAFIGLRSLLRAARDSRDRSRPVMIAQLDRHPDSDMHLRLTIKNVGASLARDVRVTFDPKLPDTSTPQWRYGAYFRRMFADTISTFGPGQELANPWWTHQDVAAPKTCTVSFAYKDAQGRTYSDQFVIAIAPFRELLTVTSSGSMLGRITALADEAKAQTKAQQALANHLGVPDPPQRVTLESLWNHIASGGRVSRWVRRRPPE